MYIICYHKIVRLYYTSYIILFVRNIETKYSHFDILCLITLVYFELFGICHMIFDRYPTCNLNQEGDIRAVVLCRDEFF